MLLNSFFIILFAILIYFLLQTFLPCTQVEKPLLIWWTPFMPNRLRDTDCHGGLQCKIAGDKNHKNLKTLAAYLFYGSHMENPDFPLPRNISTLWAVYHEESPKNYAPFLYKSMQNLFNISSTFDRSSDYPLTLQYLESFKLFTEKTYFRPVEEKNSFLRNLAPVIYIQSDCDTPGDRDGLVRNLMQYIKIDSYGKCLTNKEFPAEFSKIDSLDYYNNALMDLISKYKFVISFENAVCHDYITEKLWRPLIVGSVPIYFGSPSIEDWLPNKNSAILAKNFKNNMKNLADYVLLVNNNDSMYNSFLKHKLYGEISNRQVLEKMQIHTNFGTGHSITDFECFVCKEVHVMKSGNKFHKKKTESIYDCPKPKNTWKQHWDIGKCQSKALDLLMEKNQPFSKKDFEKLWTNLRDNHNCDNR